MTMVKALWKLPRRFLLLAFICCNLSNALSKESITSVGHKTWSPAFNDSTSISLPAEAALSDSIKKKVPTRWDSIADFYRSAIKYAHTNTDSVFYFLNQVAGKNYEFPFVLGDFKFYHLHSDPRWRTVEEKFKEIFFKNFLYYPKAKMALELNILNAEAQTRNVLQADSGFTVDKRHLDRVLPLLNFSSFPREFEVGSVGQEALWYVVMNNDISIREQYLPLFEELADSGLFSRVFAARIIDKNRVERGLPQWFGTQMHEVKGKMVLYPIADAEHIEERRRRYGFYTSFEDWVKAINSEKWK